RMNEFEHAKVYWSPSTTAHIVYGAILDKFVLLNGATYFGLPLTDETGVPGYYGRKSEFQKATIYWSSPTGANEVRGEIRNKWLAVGGPARFGLPTSDELDTGVSNGKYNAFQYVNIYFSPSTDTHEVHGAIRDKYLTPEPGGAGGHLGPLGLPTTDEYYAGASTFKNDFEHGNITWTSAGGTQISF
ncbi:MAG: sugar dehydrogenase, partial [Thermoleophilia bacterium]